MATTWSNSHISGLGLRTGRSSASQLHFYLLENLFLYMTLTQPDGTFVCAPACSWFLIKPKGRIIALGFCTFASVFFNVNSHKSLFIISNSFISIISTSSLFQWENTGFFHLFLKGFYSKECFHILACFPITFWWRLPGIFEFYPIREAAHPHDTSERKLLPIFIKKAVKLTNLCPRKS